MQIISSDFQQCSTRPSPRKRGWRFTAGLQYQCIKTNYSQLIGIRRLIVFGLPDPSFQDFLWFSGKTAFHQSFIFFSWKNTYFILCSISRAQTLQNQSKPSKSAIIISYCSLFWKIFKEHVISSYFHVFSWKHNISRFSKILMSYSMINKYFDSPVILLI